MTKPQEQHEGRELRHVIFEMVQDSDGWPPVGAERMWASEVGPGLYKIDNIPFYARGISRGDVVSVLEKDGTLFYKETREHSGHSTVRVIIKRKGSERTPLEQEVRQNLVGKGCEIEGVSEGFFAVDIPVGVNYGEVKTLLREEERKGGLEFEEGNVRKE